MPDPMTPDLDAIRELAAFVRGGYDEEMASHPDRWYCNVSADAMRRLLDGTAALMAWGEHLAAEVERLRARTDADDELISDMRVRVVAWERALGVTILPTIDDPNPAIPDGGAGDDKAEMEAALAAARELHAPTDNTWPLYPGNGSCCEFCCVDGHGGRTLYCTARCEAETACWPCPTRAALDGGAS